MATQSQNDAPEFATTGKQRSTIDVRISYRIIQLFSDGLYSSPNKAIEELVSNSYDAGALRVHVILPRDLGAEESAILTVDDGIGMDESAFKIHWLIGESEKRNTGGVRGRNPIGKFGIGKLATFALANRLTHITKVDDRFYSVSMNFAEIPEQSRIAEPETVQLPLLELTEDQARAALSPWMEGKGSGYGALQLFGEHATPSWTVAIVSSLKDLAKELRTGRLRWVLANAMPLRDDFVLYLNGQPVEPRRITQQRLGRWVLGNDIQELPRPGTAEEYEPEEDTQYASDHYLRFGLTHGSLGRICGYTELYEDSMTDGSVRERFDRSHGFFIYVRGRLVNLTDEYFGIEKNLLRHGTFSRFRAVVHIDRLDDELRSSRETIREGSLAEQARNILQGVFNFVRNKQQEFEREEDEQRKLARLSSRVSAAPTSLTKRPLLKLIRSAYNLGLTPRYLDLPHAPTQEAQEAVVQAIEDRAESEGLVVDSIVEDLTQLDGIAKLEVESGHLKLNSMHPFVAYFLDAYEDQGRRMPLALLGMSEVLIEAYLYDEGVEQSVVEEVLDRRDELLRQLAYAGGKRNPLMVANDLEDAVLNADQLEIELAEAFRVLGFRAIPKGGKDRPDGIAEAYLPSPERRYGVSLEAKSVTKTGRRVKAKTVGISEVKQHRKDFNCQHALVVAPDFEGGRDDDSSIVRQVERENAESKKLAAREGAEPETITLIRVRDLARLVRIAPTKRIGLDTLRGLFTDCATPEEAANWVNKVASTEIEPFPYRQVFEAIWELQRDEPRYHVQYTNLHTYLRTVKELDVPRGELAEVSRAIQKLAPSYLVTSEDRVELLTNPEVLFDAIRSTINQYPAEDNAVFQI